MSQIIDAPCWWSRDVVVHRGASSRRSSAGGGQVGGGMDVARPPRRAPDCGYCPGDPVMAAHALPCHTMVVAALAAPLRYMLYSSPPMLCLLPLWPVRLWLVHCFL